MQGERSWHFITSRGKVLQTYISMVDEITIDSKLMTILLRTCTHISTYLYTESSKFCSNWAEVLLSQGMSSPDPFFLRQAVENYKLKVIYTMCHLWVFRNYFQMYVCSIPLLQIGRLLWNSVCVCVCVCVCVRARAHAHVMVQGQPIIWNTSEHRYTLYAVLACTVVSVKTGAAPFSNLHICSTVLLQILNLFFLQSVYVYVHECWGQLTREGYSRDALPMA